MKPISAGDTGKIDGTVRRSAEISPDVLAGIRRLPSRDVRDLIIGALKWGMRHRTTTKGIMFYGENGLSATVHYGSSDMRAAKKVARDLRKLGYEPGRK